MPTEIGATESARIELLTRCFELVASGMCDEMLRPVRERSEARNRVSQWQEQFTEFSLRAELDGYSREEIFASAASVRSLLTASRSIRHVQTWPYGYPGDWHIIEQILDGSNRSECESWAWHLEQAALESPIAQQHHEKIFWQADEIARTLESVTPPANILVLAAGGGRDLLSASVSLRRYQPNLFVNDWDGNALILVQSRLRYILDKSSVYQESAIATARRLRQKEKFDLVLAGGLFDYLSDRKSALLIRLITGDLLKRGGRFLLTNIATGNPHRPWMEYALNWRLIERSEEDLRKLCGIAGFGVDGLDIVRDKTGLTLLSELSCER